MEFAAAWHCTGSVQAGRLGDTPEVGTVPFGAFVKARPWGVCQDQDGPGDQSWQRTVHGYVWRAPTNKWSAYRCSQSHELSLQAFVYRPKNHNVLVAIAPAQCCEGWSHEYRTPEPWRSEQIWNQGWGKSAKGWQTIATCEKPLPSGAQGVQAVRRAGKADMRRSLTAVVRRACTSAWMKCKRNNHGVATCRSNSWQSCTRDKAVSQPALSEGENEMSTPTGVSSSRKAQEDGTESFNLQHAKQRRNWGLCKRNQFHNNLEKQTSMTVICQANRWMTCWWLRSFQDLLDWLEPVDILVVEALRSTRRQTGRRAPKSLFVMLQNLRSWICWFSFWAQSATTLDGCTLHPLVGRRQKLESGQTATWRSKGFGSLSPFDQQNSHWISSP